MVHVIVLQNAECYHHPFILNTKKRLCLRNYCWRKYRSHSWQNELFSCFDQQSKCHDGTAADTDWWYHTCLIHTRSLPYLSDLLSAMQQCSDFHSWWCEISVICLERCGSYLLWIWCFLSCNWFNSGYFFGDFLSKFGFQRISCFRLRIELSDFFCFWETFKYKVKSLQHQENPYWH